MKLNPTIFREYDIRGKFPEEINREAVEAIACAFAISQRAKKIAIGRDRRQESELIYQSIVKGLAKAGCQIFDMAIESTPGL